MMTILLSYGSYVRRHSRFGEGKKATQLRNDPTRPSVSNSQTTQEMKAAPTTNPIGGALLVSGSGS